ncbi:hypothetical protein J6590_034871 [Homalodisca vitripennis]|nr:hypothetical protein J6590_034871 [Homalodisca vitripennis]
MRKHLVHNLLHRKALAHNLSTRCPAADCVLFLPSSPPSPTPALRVKVKTTPDVINARYARHVVLGLRSTRCSV